LDSTEQFGDFLRIKCGGMGADKISHCVKGCMIRACGGIFGVILWRCPGTGLQDVAHPEDSDAEAIGLTFRNYGGTKGIISECLRFCAKEMYNSECDA